MKKTKKLSLIMVVLVAILSWGFPSIAIGGKSTPAPVLSDCAEDELIVKFKQISDTETVVSGHDLKLAKKNNRLKLAKVKVPKGTALKDKIRELQSDPNVEYVEPNYNLKADMVPNDPNYNLQWGITKTNVNQAWDTTTGDASVIIAVIDSGVDEDHPDLAANLVAGYNTIINSTDTDDDYGHGTHVAGIAAGVINNGTGIAGVAGTSRIMPVKAMGATGTGAMSDIVDGIVWAADHGAKVINMSLGTTSYSQALQDAVDYAYNAGCIIIASAGNDNTSAPRYPAALNHVVGVSATTETNAKASFSNYGTYVDLASPGTNIYNTTFDGSYGYKQGTSMAAPLVSGIAALVWGERPALTPGQLERVLETSATDIGAAGKDSYFGYGLVNALDALAEPVDTSAIGLALIGDSPDPFGPTGTTTTKITFSMDENGLVTLKIYDGANNLVKTLLNGTAKTAGTQYATWNGKNDAGALVTSGEYTYKLQAEDYSGNTSDLLTGTITVDTTNPVVGGITVSADPFAPNGINSTTISYNLSENCKTTVKIYSSSNGLINTLANAVLQNTGANSVTWNGKNSSGVIVGDGIYTVKIDAVDNVNRKAIQQTKTITIEGSNPAITLVSDSPDPLKATGTSVNNIKYTLSENAVVTVEIFDVDSNLVRTLVNGSVTAGSKSVSWNGKNDAGVLVADGTYTYKINAADSANKTATEMTGTITTDKTAPVISGAADSTDPFAPTGLDTTTISYNLSESSKVTVTILNSKNATVKTLHSNMLKNAGANSVTWDGKNSSGAIVGDGIYTYKISAVDLVGWSATAVTGTITVERSNPSISAVSDSPDPFKPTGTSLNTIKYTLSENSNVVLKIFDSGGNLVRTLVNAAALAGANSAAWNGKNDLGVIVGSGTYTYIIDATDAFGNDALQVTGNIAVDVTVPVINAVSINPDPFDPTGLNTTTISYSISENCKMTVAIYTSSNVLVRTLYSSSARNAGANTAVWYGTNSKNVLVSPGTYTYKITAVDGVGLKSEVSGSITVQ